MTIELGQTGAALLRARHRDALQRAPYAYILLLALNLPARHLAPQQGLSGNLPRLALLPLLTKSQGQRPMILQQRADGHRQQQHRHQCFCQAKTLLILPAAGSAPV